jgi:hypothetical protein
LAALLPLAAIVSSLVLPAPAQATFHLISVREVYAGGAGNDSYVVLQAYSSGQNFVSGHTVTAHDSAGAQVGGFTFSGSVANGQNQMTILVADTAYAVSFPGGPSPDGTDASLNLDPAGGAVCWSGLDCVSWGSFGGALPSPAGTPASPTGVTAGKALQRSIDPGCPTLLEAGDDTNDSATDFSEQTPNPRSNTSPIVETACTAPTAAIDTKPPNPTNSTSASFTYHSTPPGAEFECRLDAEAFASCEAAGKTYAGPLSEGSHTFQVRARDVNGTGTPASYAWAVDTTAPVVTIDSHPEDPSPGASAPFAFHASETGATFECSLAMGANPDSFSACSSGKTYTSLEDGGYTFKVRATDSAENQGPPTAFGWTVDNSLLDTTPPQTTIVSKPPNPSGSSTAFFAYASNEPGSSFECTLDGAAFAACPALGMSYTGLAGGTHTFQVRARDESGNLDPTPAGYTFDVVFAVAPPAPPSPAPSSPPPAAPQPGTAFAAGLAQARGASALLRMGCRGQEGARCSGALRLLARAGRARSSRRAARGLTIGRGTYSLPAGSRRRLVRARLTRRGRRLVARAGRRGLRVRLAGSGLKQRALRLRAAGGKRRAKR